MYNLMSEKQPGSSSAPERRESTVRASVGQKSGIDFHGNFQNWFCFEMLEVIHFTGIFLE